MKNSYSEKEINIFGGVLKLARSGEDITKLTAQKIATAAGVGKATIYDYFSSKEEIIQGALAYSLSLQKQRFREEMAKTADFSKQMNIIYTGIIERVQDKGSAFQLLLQSMDKSDSGCALSPQMLGQVAEFMAILRGVLANGHDQGVIGMDVLTPENEAYVRMAILSNVFATATLAKSMPESFSRTEIIDNSYKMLLKSLG